MAVKASWLHRLTAWLPYPVRALGKRFLYGWVPGLRGSFPYFGERVFFPPGSLLFRRVCDEGVFEAPLVTAIIDLVRADTTYFDIGANIGLTSVPVLASVERCQVVSFEPSPNSLPYLTQTQAGSGRKARWTIIGKAVAERTGEAIFSLASAQDSAYEGLRDTGRKRETRQAAVQTTTVDDAWKALGHPRVSVIKSDTEGAEVQVLAGARRCIAECRPAILLEWNAINLKPYGVELEELHALAGDLGYSLYSMPDLVAITEAAVLRIKCRQTENFLLLPRR